MGIIFQDIIVVAHRTGMILAIVPALVLPFLSSIFPDETDQEFARRSFMTLKKVIQFGLIVLVLSGIIRLNYGIPTLLAIKAIAVVITLYYYFYYDISYTKETYQRNSLLALTSLIITGTIGIVL